MTLAIGIVCGDGVVVAADSRTTAGTTPMRVLSDFTHKVVIIDRVAVATSGWAFLLGRNIAGHLAAFAQRHQGANLGPMELATRLAAEFKELFDQHIASGADAPPPDGTDVLSFLVAGYEADGHGTLLEALVPSSAVVPQCDPVTHTGASWRGQTDVLSRIMHGVDLDCLRQAARGAGKEQELGELDALWPDLRYVVPLPLLNLQDAIDFAVFAIRTTIDVQRLTLAKGQQGSWPGVGGPIDIAAVTRLDGARWIQRAELVGERPAGQAERL
jgi:20S proteasome alpha/beta subunit